MSPPDPPALALRGLTKVFAGTPAVDRLDLDVPGGSFFGLVGPNGAGKTTTLSMATGLLRPDAGTAYVDGYDVWSGTKPGGPVEAKRRVGILPDGQRLFDRLSAPELLEYTGLLRGMPRDVVASRSAELLDLLDLASAGNKLVVDSRPACTRRSGSPRRCCTPLACSCWTDRSRRSTRCRQRRSARSFSTTQPPEGP